MIGANFVVDILRNHEWARKLPWRQIEMLAKLAEERHFQPGEVLFQLGDIADHFYVIASGTVGMTLLWNANTFIAQAIIDREEIGWDALIEGAKRCFTAKAMTPVKALVLNGPKLLAECDRDPQFGLLLMKHLLRVVSERLDASRLLLLIRS
jgi:CRP-like cAMP-binding protein